MLTKPYRLLVETTITILTPKTLIYPTLKHTHTPTHKSRSVPEASLRRRCKQLGLHLVPRSLGFRRIMISFNGGQMTTIKKI